MVDLDLIEARWNKAIAGDEYASQTLAEDDVPAMAAEIAQLRAAISEHKRASHAATDESHWDDADEALWSVLDKMQKTSPDAGQKE